jgi:hypothetical protein
MTFAELVNQAGTHILAGIGTTATFTSASGPEIPLRVDYDEEILLQPGAMTTEVYAPTKTIEFLLSDIGRLPVEGERFTIGESTYEVVEILQSDPYWVKCAVK